MPRAFNETEQTQLRRRLMDEAVKIFAAGGIRNTSIDQIVKSCGIAKGSFYRFFESKEALAFAVLSEIETVEQSRIINDIKNAQSLRDALCIVFDAALTSMERHPVLVRFNDPQEMWWLLVRASESQKTDMEKTDLVFAERVLAECTAHGWATRLSPEDLMLAGRYLVGLGLLASKDSVPAQGLVPADLDQTRGKKIRDMIRDGLVDRMLAAWDTGEAV